MRTDQPHADTIAGVSDESVRGGERDGNSRPRAAAQPCISAPWPDNGSANPQPVLYRHLPTSNDTQKGTDMMQLHALFASVPAWRRCSADKHITKFGAPREC
nr:hypothetical protein GCM10017611_43150 [Rhodococcus wratislaviensis]